MPRLSLLATLALLAVPFQPPAAIAETPLLMEGKQRLFERVLIRERTDCADEPGGAGTEPLAPLTPLYVYERSGEWLRVGRTDNAERTWWIAAASAVDWRQNIVVTLEGTENLGRLLFFGDPDTLYEVVEAESPADAAGKLRDEAAAAELSGLPHDRVVALGPRQTVDLRRNLYVMPILESEEAVFENGALVNVLKVAVARADPGGDHPARRATPIPGGEAEARENFRAAVVFVVDTSSSMQPYIDGTREALETIIHDISASEAGDAVTFGLVGHRDNLAGEPVLGYAVRTYAPLEPGTGPERFLEALRGMREADVSSRHFREDSFAGIDHAIRTLDWEPYAARWIVHVTDAPPRGPDDELSATGLSAEGLATQAAERLGAAIAVLHLRTEAGDPYHASAEAAYRALTRHPNQEPLYFPVEDGEPGLYREAAGRLARLIIEQVAEFRGGADPEEIGAGADDPMAEAVQSAGRTMQLAYLGRVEGTRAPDVFEAYVADRDFERTGLKPLSVRLLITKNQLSDLDEALRLVIQKAEENVIDPTAFFQQVLGAAADMSRRPEDVAARGEASLAEAAAIDEYLEGLPYTSRIMQITESDWIGLSFAEQQAIVNELYDKIERYRRYNEATDQWVDYLGAGGGADTLVYPMVLDDLP